MCVAQGRALAPRRGRRRRGDRRRQRQHRRLARARRAPRARGSSRVRRKGYGNALIRGIRAARGTYVLMADADDSYDLENLGPFLEQLARRRRPRDGQPVRGRHRAGRDAVAAPPHRQPGAVGHRPPVLPHAGSRLPLRHPRVPQGRDRRPRPARGRHGVRERDDREGEPGRSADQRGAHDAAPRRPLPRAAPAQLPRRLAPPAVPAVVLPELVVRRARARRCSRSARSAPPRSRSGTSAASTSPASCTRRRS